MLFHQFHPLKSSPLPQIYSVWFLLQCLLAFRTRLIEHWPDAAVRLRPEESAVLSFRGQLFRYLKGLRGISRLRGRLASRDTLQAGHDAIE